jgi:hypothetical protein
VGNGSGLSRGDRNRNARLARLRELVPLGNAIVGIDLADDTQAAVAGDHDSRVIARRRVSVRAWELGEVLDWAAGRAAGAGFASVTWRASRPGTGGGCWTSSPPGGGLALVCVQPLLGLPGPRGRGPDPGQVRPEGRGADRAAGRRAALLRAGAGQRGAGAAAAPGGAPQPADDRRDGGGEPDPGSGRMRLARGAGHLTEPVPVGDLVRVAGAGSGAPGTCAGCGGRAWTGSPRRCEGSCRGGAGSGRACGSSGPCSPRWPIPPGSPRTAPARWSARTRAPGRLAGYPRPPRRYRDPDGRGPG